MANSSVTMQPCGVIKARLGINAGGKVQRFFTNECYRYMGKYVVGGASGSINMSASLAPDYIQYNHPGSHYQWAGMLYVDPKTKKGAFYSEDYGFWSRPGVTKIPTSRPLKTNLGGSHWEKRMWSAEGSKVLANTQKYMERGCK